MAGDDEDASSTAKPIDCTGLDVLAPTLFTGAHHVVQRSLPHGDTVPPGPTTSSLQSLQQHSRSHALNCSRLVMTESVFGTSQACQGLTLFQRRL